MSNKNFLVIRSAVIASLAGLIFGLDIGVMSGVEQPVQGVFNLSDILAGLTVPISLIGTIIGSMFAAKPADKYGRKQVLIVLAVLFGVSISGCSIAQSWAVLMIFRFLSGLAVGAMVVIAPMYIAEIAPAHIRGRLVGLFQLNVVTGILLGFLSNYFINELFEISAWRYMLGVEIIPSALFFTLLFLIPATPRWLALNGKLDEAKLLLARLGSVNVDEEFEIIKESIKSNTKSGTEKLFQKKYRMPIILAFLIAFFNQMAGINAIMFYAPRIFSLANFGGQGSLLAPVSLGFTNLIFTIIAISIIDKFGRKKLLLIGSVGMVFSLFMVGKFFINPDASNPYTVIAYLVTFIAFFAFSQGAVLWVYISEIFPISVRAKGQTLGSLTHWIMAALTTWLFPIVISINNGSSIVFFVFGGMMLIQLVVVAKWFPETKDKTLEEIQKELVK
jgi:sugar porter (SP) family MFS transporter